MARSSSAEYAAVRRDRGFVPTIEPGATAVPSISSGFTDSHFFRSAFGNVAYGFMPKRTTPIETWPLIHSADERVLQGRPGARRRSSSCTPRATIGELGMSAEPSDKVRLGGMALRNGILVHSFDHWAAAVRTPEGEIKLASGRKPELPDVLVNTPRSFAASRGWPRSATCCRRFGAGYPRLGCRSRRRAWARALAASALISTGGAAARSCRWRSRRVSRSAMSLVPALMAIRGSQVAGYHGAEHKAIGGYEQDTDAIDVAKEHERCGSHMVGPMLVATAAGSTLVGSQCPHLVAAPLGC